MIAKVSVAALVFAAGLALPAVAQNAGKYPAFSGQWERTIGAQWDPSKPSGLRQEAPLIPEYQAILERNVKAIRNGDETYNLQAYCMPSGMPRMMIAYEPLEFIVTPEFTIVHSDHLTEIRHIYTDGRDWPAQLHPAFSGNSIGKWIDEDGDGQYDALEVETRGFKGPRNFDANGVPLHADNQTILKERLWLDKTNRNKLLDEVTTFDHALTRPWTVTRSYGRVVPPQYLEHTCAEDNHHVLLDHENYFLTVDGFLMPTRKNQPPPDLRNFAQPH